MQVAMAMSGRCYRCGHLHSNGKERELPTFISLTLRSSSRYVCLYVCMYVRMYIYIYNILCQ